MRRATSALRADCRRRIRCAGECRRWGEDLIAAVKKMMKREREAFLEDLLAATSLDYLKSIQEARADDQAGRVKIHAEVFGGKRARFKT